jgi:hypothetical protein
MNDTVCAYLLVLKPLTDLLGSLHAEGFGVESQLVLALPILFVCVCACVASKRTLAIDGRNRSGGGGRGSEWR